MIDDDAVRRRRRIPGPGSGRLGPSAALARTASGDDALVDLHLHPAPRLELGRALAAAGATAMIDLSDGLATDAGHLAAAGAVGLELDLDRLPVTPGVPAVAAALGRPAAELAATAGEDFELCACLPPDAAVPPQCTVIGRVAAGPPPGTIPPGARTAGAREGLEHPGW